MHRVTRDNQVWCHGDTILRVTVTPITYKVSVLHSELTPNSKNGVTVTLYFYSVVVESMD